MKHFNQKYLLTSLGLTAVLVMAVMPASITFQEDTKFYGAAEIVLYDTAGNEKFSQTIHNRLVDTGEQFLLQAAFQDGTTVADNAGIGSICVSAQPTAAVIASIVEGYTATTFDTNDGVATANCKEDTTVTVSGGTAVIGPLNFEAGGTANNVTASTTITNIGICQNAAEGDTDFVNCATTGILFAAVDTSDVTLAAGESVNVTYTFDISSSGT